MNFHLKTLVAALSGAVLLYPGLIVGGAAEAADAVVETAQAPANRYPHRVGIDVVRQHALLPKRDGAMLIDSRPAARKYDIGHIPTAVNIPDLQFDKLAPVLLPRDKAQLLIFYCDGPACTLSHNSAFKAEKLGYTNVRVYAEGFPDWIAQGNAAAVTATVQMVAGKEAGTITVASFERILREAPDTIHLIDVREPGEFASGSFRGAINMPINTLEKNLDKLPGGKPIVFFCGAGGRSGEAHDMVKTYRPEVKTVFLDADIRWTATGDYTIAAK